MSRAGGAVAPANLAPKGPRTPPGKPPAAGKGKPSGKPPSAGKGPSANAAQAQPQYTGQNIFYPSGPQSPAQLEALADKITKGQLRNELEPLKTERAETQLGEKQALGQYGNASNVYAGQLQGLQQGAEAGAKTYENRVAESALQAGKAIETAGQNALTRSGGYLDPQVAQQIARETSTAAGTAATQGTLAQTLGQNETNFMANIRAAGGQRALEGQQRLQGAYAREQGKIGSKERELIAKQPNAAKSLGVELGQKYFNDQALLSKLGVAEKEAVRKAGEGQAKIAIARTESSTRAKGQHSKEISERAAERFHAGELIAKGEANRVAWGRLNASERKNATDAWFKHEEASTHRMSAEDKQKYDAARIQVDKLKAEGKAAPSRTQGNKYLQKINDTMSQVRTEVNAQFKKGARGEKLWAEVRKGLASGMRTGKGAEAGTPVGQNLISAAVHLVRYGHFSRGDEAEALSQGMDPAMSPQWWGKSTI